MSLSFLKPIRGNDGDISNPFPSKALQIPPPNTWDLFIAFLKTYSQELDQTQVNLDSTQELLALLHERSRVET